MGDKRLVGFFEVWSGSVVGRNRCEGREKGRARIRTLRTRKGAGGKKVGFNPSSF